MYQYLLFDLDGTLTDPSEGITKSVQHALAALGIDEPDRTKLLPFIGPPLIPSFMEFYGMSEEKAREGVVFYREYFSREGLYQNKVLEGIPHMLQKLQEAGKFLAIASSKPEEFVRKILDKFDLTRYFDEIVGASMDEKRTIKADVITEALRRIGLKEEDKDRVLMIGDRKHDVEGAKQCGIHSLGVYIGFAQEGELEEAKADHICASVEEMEAFLLSC